MSLIRAPAPIHGDARRLQALSDTRCARRVRARQDRITTIRRVLLPSVRSNIATGATLGISRIIGDTAIVRRLRSVRRLHSNPRARHLSSACCEERARR